MTAVYIKLIWTQHLIHCHLFMEDLDIVDSILNLMVEELWNFKLYSRVNNLSEK